MFKNLIWDFTGKAGVQLILLICSLFLTRLLEPAAFGTAGIAMVIIFFSTLFIDFGFNRAIIQYQELTDEIVCSVFWINMLIAIVFAGLLFLSAGFIADFFNYSGLKDVIKVLSLIFIFTGLSIVPSAILSRQMKFKDLSIAALVSAALSGVTGIIMALKGFGVWSLVVQYLLSSFTSAVLCFYFAKWKVKMPAISSFIKVKPLWTYGGRLFFSSLLNTIVTRLDIVVIGKLYNAIFLGFYTRAQSLDNVIRTVSSGSITSVFFSAAAKLQDNKESLLFLYKRYLNLISFGAIGMAAVFYLVSPGIFNVLFTEKWNTAAVYFQLMAIISFAWPISSLMVSVIAGVGNSKSYLKLEIIKSILLLAALVTFFVGDIQFFLLIMIGIRIMLVCWNASFVSRELNITVMQQLKTILHYLLPAIALVIIIKKVLPFTSINQDITNVFTSALLFTTLYISVQFVLKTPLENDLILLYKKAAIKFRKKPI